MKSMFIGAAILAAATAPQAVLAAESSDMPSTFTAAAGFAIVDAESGRVVGTLVPVAGSPGTLRLIGTAHAPAAGRASVSGAMVPALTPDQMIQQRVRDTEAQFHIDHTS